MKKNILCNEKDSIRQALRQINENQKGTVFVVDNNNILKNVVVDGDIRRALLNGVSLEDSVSDIEKKEFVQASINTERKILLKLLNDHIRIIPLVNENGQVVDYCEYKKLSRLPIAEPQLDGNELEYVLDAVQSTWISSTGKYIGIFEENFSQYCDTKYGVAVSNGTVALHLALVALGIGKGDEVIIPDITFAATINAVLYTGATPVVVDIEDDSWCIDPVEIEKAISDKTKAIIPVHIYGQPCDMDKIMRIAKENKLYVIEDCAEAHGATYNGKKVGSFGDIGCFSFFGNKVITTGEGGMCITNNPKLEEKMRIYKDHGMSKEKKYYHDVIGFNYRMTNIQAAIGVAQLEKIDYILKKRKALEEMYRDELRTVNHVSLQKNDLIGRKKITWLITVLTDTSKERDKCFECMKKENVDIRPFFVPLSNMSIYKQYIFSNKNSDRISKLGFNLPTSYRMTEEDVKYVVDIIRYGIKLSE